MICLQNGEITFSHDNDNLQFWKIIKVNNDGYKIQNINNCYILIKSNKAYCLFIPENKASQFNFLKIFNEVNNQKQSNINKEILKNEPIDI